MLDLFKNYIREHNLFQPNEKVLLGISGGLDSVVMMDLFHRSGYPFAVAHCNFQLRGNDSDEDEKLVRRLAQHYQVQYYGTRFNTGEYARENSISIEMAARDLRYEWFENIREKGDFDWIAVAHHADDSRETFLLNLIRGTGIRGLRGIQPKVGKVIRPLLFANRNDLIQYTIDFQLEFRDDQSNWDTTFLRNKIRHEVLPLLEEMNPSFRESLSETMERLNEAGNLLNSMVERKRAFLVKEIGNQVFIDLEKIRQLSPRQTWLFELLRPYNFKTEVVREISKTFEEGISGKKFFSSTHRLIRDRESLIISPLEEDVSFRRYYIDAGIPHIDSPIELEFSILENTPDFQIPRTNTTACLDLDKLTFPLIIRKWQQGDYFCPLGMKGMKKVSDFFIDRKFSIPQKEASWLLTCGSKIVWIIGHRLDDRFKITAETKKILLIKKNE